MNHGGFNREASWERVRQRSVPWDIVVIGGGATGVGIALDAATRNLDVLLVEQSDFGKGTSSRSTKLVHGGVRYLRQGNITLVRDALRERTLLRNNSPHLVHDMPFLIPCHSLWQRIFYSIGLKVYDFLAVRNSFGRSHGLSATKATQIVPALRTEDLRGGVVYHDGQFDDARLLLNMARTASDQGACLLNYVSATGLIKSEDEKITGIRARDEETGDAMQVDARCVINAGGPFCDGIRRMDDASNETMIAPSQGVHIVLPRRFFPGDTAMIVPKTSDGRVLFIIPWHDHAIVGTTDTPIPNVTLEPSPQREEIQFLLQTTAEYLATPPKLEDVLSTFTGIRPLVKGDKSARTASLSRDHVIRVSPSGLITIAGGKWTTVRKMAEDCVDRAVRDFALACGVCKTKTTPLHGSGEPVSPANDPRSFYGSDLAEIARLESESPDLAEQLHASLSLHKSDIIWAVRYEMARTIEDILARRSRALFLNARAALQVAPQVARIMADELGRDETWCGQQRESFNSIAENYVPGNGTVA